MVDWQHQRLRKAAEATSDETAFSAGVNSDGSSSSSGTGGGTDTDNGKGNGDGGNGSGSGNRGSTGNGEGDSGNGEDGSVNGNDGGNGNGRGSGNGGGNGVGEGYASWGTFLVFTSHGQGRRAREALEVAFSPSSVLTVAHNRRQGGCFMVHASAAAVDSLLLLDRQAEGREVGLGQGRKEKQGDRERGGGEEELFQGFVALPPSLKLSTSLLDHGSINGGGSGGGGGGSSTKYDGSASSNDDDHDDDYSDDGKNSTRRLTTTATTAVATSTTLPGKALHKDGIAVLLSPGSASRFSGSEEGGGEKALALRWRREWSATNLDLHGLSFWSHTAHQMGESAGVEAGVGTGSAGEAEELLVREWGWAARTVHALALRRGVSPAEACGWNDVRVAAESDGRITVRGQITLFI